jgi:dinuclear metal center YbgI/SA1388 family protein
MLKVADLVRAMDTIAPVRLAAPWDNVGLLVGDPDDELTRVMVTIDFTPPVFDEAVRGGYAAVVAYHPPIFEAAKRFGAGSMAYAAARAKLAVYTPHTSLDAADGGTNDVLADAAAMTDRTPLRAIEGPDVEYKLATFVPAEHADAVGRAVFAAGAGRIGKYSSCSFRAPGVGTFFGEEGAKPTVGEQGQFEQAPEVRIETVVPIADVDAVVRALLLTHPYEEPAFDLVRLARAPEARGFGKIGRVPSVTLRGMVERIKRALAISHVLVGGELDRHVTRMAVCAGSGGDFVPDAIAAGADVLLTGELRHHDALRALAHGMAVVCVLHSVSERAALDGLQRKLIECLPGVEIAKSKQDRDPFVFA